MRERIRRLRKLETSLLALSEEIGEALRSDFGKPFEEVLLTEIAPVIVELRHTVRHLNRWMKPRRVSTQLILAGTASHVRYEGKGPSLIISPWNYAFTLTLCPIISAVAAGCPVILKPSEFTPAATSVLKRLLDDVFPEDEVAVCSGDASVAQSLLELPFRHIYFTGSPAIGKKVMAAASNHLASVTLELGGKSPAVVDATADLDATARRIVFGKFANAGQTCIAPDYLLVQQSVYEELVSKLIVSIRLFYGDRSDAAAPSRDLSRIVSHRHAERLISLLDDAKNTGAEILYGGTYDLEARYIEPTLLAHVDTDSRLMKEEIFGPILPILQYRNTEELSARLGAMPPPLSLYIFSRDRKSTRDLVRNTEAGCISVNETLLHFSNPNLPFGGLTTSGIGRGHGYAGFLAFSNEKAVFRQHMSPWLFSHMQPPFSKHTRKWIRALIRFS